MDNLKIKLDVVELFRTIDRLEKCIDEFDYRGVGRELYLLRQVASKLKNELGVRFDKDDHE